MKFGEIIAEQKKRFPFLQFFGYKRLKDFIKEDHATTSEQFMSWVDEELKLLDKGHEKMIECGTDSRVHYKWSQLNAVAVAKIIKKWNRRCADVGGQIHYEIVAERLRETKFYHMTYCWTAPSEKIECALCLDVVTDPVLYTAACTHHFCAGCAVKTACTQAGFGCPICRQGTLRTLSLAPVPEQLHADEWPKASTLLSSLQKLESLCSVRELEAALDEKKQGAEDQKVLRAPPPISLKPMQAPDLDMPLLELPGPKLDLDDATSSIFVLDPGTAV